MQRQPKAPKNLEEDSRKWNVTGGGAIVNLCPVKRSQVLENKIVFLLFSTGWRWIWSDRSSTFSNVNLPGEARGQLSKPRSAQNSGIVHQIKHLSYQMKIAVNCGGMELWSRNVSSLAGFAGSVWKIPTQFKLRVVITIGNMPNKEMFFNMIYFDHISVTNVSHVSVRLLSWSQMMSKCGKNN